MQLRLNGLREAFADNIDSFDDCLEAMYTEHGSDITISPFLQLIGLVVTTVVSHHVTSTMYAGNLPGAADTLANNPGLVQAMLQGMQPAANNTPPPPPPSPEQPTQQQQPQQRDVAMDRLSSMLAPLQQQPKFHHQQQPAMTSMPSQHQSSDDDDSGSEISSVIRRGKPSTEITIDV
jgi:hypothetical protein